MGTLGVSMAEKRLVEHLRLGGRPDDDVGRELIGRFVAKVWQDPSVAPVIRQHAVTIQELGAMYAAVLQSLMPEPWMNVSGPMLVPTQWFMEPYRLENLLVETTRDASGGSRNEWLRDFINNAEKLARATKHMHDERHGPPNIQVIQAGGVRPSKGCAGLLICFACALAGEAVAILWWIV